MIHNLAVTKYADATPINNDFCAYPNSTSLNDKPKTYIPQQGILYSWSAVTKDSQQKLDQKQSTVLDATPGTNEVERVEILIQGICPNGWHVPSDREWTALTKELYLNPTQYSNYESSEIPSLSWNSAWDTATDAEQASTNDNDSDSYGAGNVAKDLCKVLRTDDLLPPQKGFSKPLKEGGFNVQFTGFVSSSHSFDYGLKSFLWSASANSNTAYVRMFSAYKSGVQKINSEKTDLHSVRCKRN